MSESSPTTGGSKGGAISEFINWLSGLLAGAGPQGANASDASIPLNNTSQSPQEAGSDFSIPLNSNHVPQVTPTTPPTPMPTQTSMAHPMMQLQMAKAGLPPGLPQQQEEAQRQMKKPTQRKIGKP